MSGHARVPRTRHVIGLILTVLAAGMVVMVWIYGLHFLNGTILEELQYVIFAALVIAFLSGLQNLLSRFDR